MNELHRHRSLTDSGRHPFDGSMAHIADRKDAGNIGLEQKGIAVERPSLGTLPATYQVRTGQQETPLIPLDYIRQPIGPWQSPNEDEHGAGRHSLDFSGIRTHDRKLFQMSFTMRLGHAGMGPELNVRCFPDLVD